LDTINRKDKGVFAMKNNNFLPFDVNVLSQIADLKETEYTNILVLSSLIELLIEKGLITEQELSSKILQADQDSLIDKLGSLS